MLCKLSGVNMFTQCVSDTFIIYFFAVVLWDYCSLLFIVSSNVVLYFMSGTEPQPVLLCLFSLAIKCSEFRFYSLAEISPSFNRYTAPP